MKAMYLKGLFFAFSRVIHMPIPLKLNFYVQN